MHLEFIPNSDSPGYLGWDIFFASTGGCFSTSQPTPQPTKGLQWMPPWAHAIP
jgi:hypothetical protein